MAAVRKVAPAPAPIQRRVVTLPEVEVAFSKLWPGKSFRPFQQQVVGSALGGTDTLGVFAVGNGKSACFQAPAVALSGTTLVVSPLIALMKDQVDASRARGIPADCIHSNMDENEIASAMERSAKGEIKLLYVAPERLWSPTFSRMLRDVDVPLLACDEAHCCSRFSSFRPAYLRISSVVNMMRRRPVIMGLTATMTPHIEAEVIKALGMSSTYNRFVGDPIRPNLDYQAVWATGRKGAEWQELERLLYRFRGDGRHIVYSGSRKGAELIAGKILDKFPSLEGKVGYYHAGMDREPRRRVQDEFVSGEKTVIVATVAFGMGIDIPDIRTVVNFGIPGSMEDCVQMGGRAGRDGKESLWKCIGSDYSKSLQERFINSGYPEWATYEEVQRYLKAKLADGETLYQSAESMMKVMVEENFRATSAGYDASAIGSVLHSFEAYGMVTRRPTSSAFDITVYRAAVDQPLDGRTASVRDAILRLAGHPPGYPGATSHAVLEVDQLATASNVPRHLVSVALVKLHDLNCIKRMPSYNGKSTSWNAGMRDRELTEVIDREIVEERRGREMERLQHVVDFVSSRDPRSYIRNYFVKPTE